MSLEEKAAIASDVAARIAKKASRIQQLALLIMQRHEVNGEVLEYTQSQKQKAFTAYQTVKAEIKQLTDDLP